MTLFRLAVSVSICLALITSHLQADDQISLEDLYAPVVDSQFSVSPDGLTVANSANLVSEYGIRFTGTQYSESKSLVSIGFAPPDNIQWTNYGITYETGGQIYIANFGGGRGRRILNNLYVEDGKLSSVGELKRSLRAWRVAHTLPDRENTILVTGYSARGYSSVYEFDMTSLEPTELISGKRLKADGWIVDRSGTTRMAIREDKANYRHFIEDGNGGWVEHDELHAGKPIQLNFNGETFLDQRVVILDYGYNGEELILAENLSNNNFRVIQYNPIAGEVTKVILEDDRYDVFGRRVGKPTLMWDNATATLAGINYLRDRYVTAWFDERFQGYQTTLEDKFPNTDVTLIDWSDDHSVIVAHRGYVNTAGETFVFMSEKDQITALAAHSPALDPAVMPETSTVSYTTRDGYEIEAFLTLPRGVPPQNLPLIVHPHGGPHVRSLGELNRDSAYFALQGYAVLDMNFRGSTGYGRQHLLSGFDKLATLMIDDIADGAQWAIQSGLADPERIFAMGWSYGGYAALMGAIRYPDLYKAVVSAAAPTDMVLQMNHYKKEKYYLATAVWKTLLGDPKREKEAQRAISPLFRLDELKTPVFLVHGDEDPIVPVAHAIAFEEAAKANNIPAKVRIIRGEGHGFQYLNNRAYYLESALAHFNAASQ